MSFQQPDSLLRRFFPLLPIILGNLRLIRHMAIRGVEQRYRGSVLGLLWSVAQPLMLLLIYAFVFGVIFKARWGMDPGGGTGNFAVIMFCGMAIFNIFTDTVNSSAISVALVPNLVKKVVFPVEILPVARLVASLLLGIPWFVLLAIGAACMGFSWHASVLLLPILLLPILLLSLGVAYVAAAITVYVLDMRHIATLLVQVLFFATPILYPADMIPERFRWALTLNPMAGMVEQVRGALLFGQWPDWLEWGRLMIVGLAVCHAGLICFLKMRKGFADVL